MMLVYLALNLRKKQEVLPLPTGLLECVFVFKITLVEVSFPC